MEQRVKQETREKNEKVEQNYWGKVERESEAKIELKVE